MFLFGMRFNAAVLVLALLSLANNARAGSLIVYADEGAAYLGCVATQGPLDTIWHNQPTHYEQVCTGKTQPFPLGGGQGDAQGYFLQLVPGDDGYPYTPDTHAWNIANSCSSRPPISFDSSWTTSSNNVCSSGCSYTATGTSVVNGISTTQFSPNGAVCSGPPPSAPADGDLGGCCGPEGSQSSLVGHPINTANGNKYLQQTDVTGLLRFDRYYNSAANAPSYLLGPHWTNTLNRRVVTLSSTSVVVYRPDGSSFLFTLNGSLWQGRAGVTASLTRLVDGNSNLIGWSYRERDDRQVESFDALGRLSAITRLDGQSLALVYNYGAVQNGPNDYLPTSVTAQDGRKLVLLYDTAQRLVRLTDPSGAEINYAYDASGRLQSVTYPGPATRIYLYNESSYTGGANLPYALTGVVDEKNQRYATYKYQADGRAISTELAGGVDKYSLVYNTDGTTSVTKPQGVVQQRGFNRATVTTRVSSASETVNGQVRSISYTFDANGKTDVVTDASGVTSDYDFNSRGLVTQQVESANVAATKRTTQTDWHASFNVPTEIRILDASNGLESRSTWTYNSHGQVTTASLVNLTNPALTQTSTYTYCEQAGVTAGNCPIVGLLVSIDGPRTDVSDVSTYTYRQTDEGSCVSAPTACPYRKGDLWKVTNAKGQVTETLKYDGAGRPLSVKDANNVVTDVEYNARGWMTARKVRGSDNNSEADDAITRIEYDATGAVTKVTEPDGAFLSFTYDSAHRLTDLTDAAGHKIHYTLDNAGNRVQEDTMDAAAVVKRSLSRIYDSLGQLQTTADAYATPTDFTYDLNGNLNTATDPLLRVTDNDVDALGRLQRIIANTGGSQSDKASSQFVYDARDNLRTVVDPKGLSTNYTFDSTNNLTQLSSPDTGSTIYTYDSAGNRVGEIRADNVSQGFVYDPLGRLTNQTFAQSAQNIAFAYDTPQSDCTAGETYGVGRLSKFSDNSGSTSLCYDIRGNLVRKVQSVTIGTVTTSFTVGATYNAGGRLTAMTYPSGAVVAYYRDANGRIIRVDAKPTATAAQVPLVSSVSYLPFGPVSAMTFGNGRTLTKDYDRNYRIASVSDSASTNPLSESFTLDSAGNITGLTERTSASATATRTFTYDGLDRLTAQKNGATSVEGFSYDATGNRLSKTAGSTTAYAYPSTSHRLSSVGSTGRTYNATGETLTIGNGGSSKKFTYDLRHRQATYSANNTLKLTNLYNAIGQRVAKQSVPASGSTQFVYDEAGHLLGEYTTTGARIKEYVWVGDTLVAVLGTFDGQDYHFVETDHLGTPRAMVHPSKNTIEWRWDVNPTSFGEHAPNANPDGDSLTYTLNLRFPGQYYDLESGINYNYFRDYEPATGRYIESDPIGLAGGPASYAYVNSRSLVGTDRFGLKTCVLTTRRGSGNGNHSAIYVDRGPEGYPFIYDPAGGYAGSLGQTHGWAEGPNVSLTGFVNFHYQEGGDTTVAICRNTTAEQEDKLGPTGL